MKTNLNAIFFSVAIVIAAMLLGYAYRNKANPNNVISVTGLAEKQFTSDLIVWEGSFSKYNFNLKQAYNDLEVDKKIIGEYLKANGANAEDIVFRAVQTEKNVKRNYTDDGKFLGEDFAGYTLTQSVQISSKEVEKVEGISRKITELLNKGIQLYSSPPRYYFTKLSDLKIELVSKATEDARLRAENIAKMSGSKISKLENAQMGIFQITGLNSDEEYSWGGAFNTSSKEKTASITMKLTYKIK